MKPSSLFKTKKVVATFAVIALLGAFFFFNNTITGNLITKSNNSISLLSIIGLMLIICSIILGAYAIKKK